MLEVEEVQNRKYTVEFKQQAIDLAASLGSTKKAAQQLGVPDTNIHQWKRRLSGANGPAGESQ